MNTVEKYLEAQRLICEVKDEVELMGKEFRQRNMLAWARPAENLVQFGCFLNNLSDDKFNDGSLEHHLIEIKGLYEKYDYLNSRRT